MAELMQSGYKKLSVLEERYFLHSLSEQGQIQSNEGGTAWSLSLCHVAVQRSEAKRKNLLITSELMLFLAPFSQISCNLEVRIPNTGAGELMFVTDLLAAQLVKHLAAVFERSHQVLEPLSLLSICQLLKKTLYNQLSVPRLLWSREMLYSSAKNLTDSTEPTRSPCSIWELVFILTCKQIGWEMALIYFFVCLLLMWVPNRRSVWRGTFWRKLERNLCLSLKISVNSTESTDAPAFISFSSQCLI